MQDPIMWSCAVAADTDIDRPTENDENNEESKEVSQRKSGWHASVLRSEGVQVRHHQGVIRNQQANVCYKVFLVTQQEQTEHCNRGGCDRNNRCLPSLRSSKCPPLLPAKPNETGLFVWFVTVRFLIN